MKTIINWLKKQNEFIPLIIAFLVFYYSPYALRWIDPTAGTYDIGILQVFITAIIGFCTYQAIVWMALNINWPMLRDYFENHFRSDFKTLTPWQKIQVSLYVYSLLLASIVVLSRVI
jgi:hypothetical protein